ncbi:MAG: protein-tyrosine phosphatase family protein [Myxococcales bacterium]
MSFFSSLAHIKAPRFIHAFADAVEADAKKIALEAEVGGAEAIGYAELIGFRYPVKAYHFKVSDTLTRGSRLDVQGLKDLAAQGFKGVVNLCREYDDSDKVQAAGLTPLHLQIVDNTAPSQDQMKQVLDFANQVAHQHCYVHCEAGKGRTGVAVGCYRMAIQGWSIDDALADGKKFGLQLINQIEFLQKFYVDLHAGKIAGYPL